MVALLSEHQKTFRDLAITYIKKHGRLRILAIAGPNGSGKTTLIRGILGKFPNIFCEVVQVTTRPLGKHDRARRFVSFQKLPEEKIVLSGVAGIYNYGYALDDLLFAIKKNKIIIFEGISRLKKLKNILDRTDLDYMIVGVLPPGKTIGSMIKKLKVRLLARPGSLREDVQKKLQDSESRVIPEVLRESHIIICSCGNHSDTDAEKVMKEWERKS